MMTNFWKSCLIVCSTLLLGACSNAREGVDVQYNTLLDTAMEKAGENSVELERAITKAPAAQKNGMAFLIAYMPERDLTTLKSDFLLENTRLAYQAREEFAWAQDLPDSIFFNEVLPYAVFNERRDNWRGDFYDKFAPLVKDAKTVYEAIDAVNKNIKDIVAVKYSTEREKPDQSPYESMDQGLASCTGLSILLADAFRAVGIPARIAGTPNWTKKQGNHNWNEVWIDGNWYFTEYYPNALNKSWFLADAGVADDSNPAHWMYASSWKKTQYHYPLVWDMDITYVPAHNVTDRYLELWQTEQANNLAKKNKVGLRIMMFKDEVCTLTGDNRMAAHVQVLKANEVINEGETSGPTQDMNEIMEVYLDKNQEYTVKYTNAKGKLIEKTITTGEDKQMDLRLYMM